MQEEKHCRYQYAEIELPVVRGLVMVNTCIKKLLYRSNVGLLEQRGCSGKIKERETSVFYKCYMSHYQITSNGKVH
jgi:hypothetical protein